MMINYLIKHRKDILNSHRRLIEGFNVNAWTGPQMDWVMRCIGFNKKPYNAHIEDIKYYLCKNPVLILIDGMFNHISEKFGWHGLQTIGLMSNNLSVLYGNDKELIDEIKKLSDIYCNEFFVIVSGLINELDVVPFIRSMLSVSYELFKNLPTNIVYMHTIMELMKHVDIEIEDVEWLEGLPYGSVPYEIYVQENTSKILKANGVSWDYNPNWSEICQKIGEVVPL